MISEKDLADLEKVPFEERVARIEKMVEGKEKPSAFELGLLLAVKMGQEIREKKPLGSDTENLVASWSGKHPDSVVEEAIAFAKEFLTHPGNLASKLKEQMLKPKTESIQGEAQSNEAQPGENQSGEVSNPADNGSATSHN
ncbi:MAG: hypothetical protein HUK21_09070 [Fibrobacteraceae bacterium]|nr:hypothetical protein [Fibrobacteraceae bacterium]